MVCHECHAALHKGGEAVRRFRGWEEGRARRGGGGFSMWWKPLLGEEEEAVRVSLVLFSFGRRELALYMNI